MIERIIARLACKLKGHLRGKRIEQTQTHKTYKCPRCDATWQRKVSSAAS